MNRDGFSLIEVMIGMLIFVVGVLALAATTGFVSVQLQAANLRSDRSIVNQQAAERLRAVDFETGVVDLAAADAIALGEYSVWWEVDEIDWDLREVAIISEGPAYREGQRQTAVVDTMTIRIARPVE